MPVEKMLRHNDKMIAFFHGKLKLRFYAVILQAFPKHTLQVKPFYPLFYRTLGLRPLFLQYQYVIRTQTIFYNLPVFCKEVINPEFFCFRNSFSLSFSFSLSSRFKAGLTTISTWSFNGSSCSPST